MDKNKVIDILRADQNTDEIVNTAFVIGQKLFIRTITVYLTGQVADIFRCGNTYFLKLEEAAWIAVSGRFMDAIDNGNLDEVEPTKSPVLVNVASIVDVFNWNHPLPRDQK